jgi:hypothetical protein
MAHQNRPIDERYSFDEPTIGDYPFILSNAAPRHRFVATGTWRGPWGLTIAGKFTIATPIPQTDIAFFLAPGQTFPSGSSGMPVAATPPTTFGYRDLDVQVTKNFALSGMTSMYVRIDLLNAFNYANYADYIANWGSNGVADPDPVRYNTIGNITGVPRTLKASLGMKF